MTGIRDTFLGRPTHRGPYIIAIAGSVAVGKSTFARVLQAVMARWPDHPNVALVTTDGFLYPNSKLVADGIMHRKGFPESYDRKHMVKFLAAVKAGEHNIEAPIYSHVSYDIVPDQFQVIDQPDILIFEGLNVLQTDGVDGLKPSTIVSDFFDFSVYLDADEQDIEQWYVARFLMLQKTSFRARGAYFRKLADLTPEEAPRPRARSGGISTASTCWKISCRPASAPTWCCARRRTIRSARSGYVNHEALQPVAVHRPV
ncbi:type I pantothenate kinase [Pseudomonas sp. PCH446]